MASELDDIGLALNHNRVEKLSDLDIINFYALQEFLNLIGLLLF